MRFTAFFVCLIPLVAVIYGSSKTNYSRDCNKTNPYPIRNPSGLKIKRINNSSLEVSWESVPDEFHCGPNATYALNIDRGFTVYSEKNVTSPYIFTPEYPSSALEFSVVTLLPGTKQREGEAWHIIEFADPGFENKEYHLDNCSQSSQKTPIRNPSYVKLKNATSNSLTIEWEMVPDAYHCLQSNDKFEYYVNMRGYMKYGSVYSSQNSTTFLDLEPNEYYEFVVKSKNNQGVCYSDNTAGIVAHTLPGPPSKNPKNVTVESSSCSKLDVSWEAIVLESGKELKLSFMVLYRKTESNGSWDVRHVSDYETMKTSIENLDCGTNYTVKVLAANKFGNCPDEPEEHYGTTTFDTPRDNGPPKCTNPKDFIIDIMDYSKLNVSWPAQSDTFQAVYVEPGKTWYQPAVRGENFVIVDKETPGQKRNFTVYSFIDNRSCNDSEKKTVEVMIPY